MGKDFLPNLSSFADDVDDKLIYVVYTLQIITVSLSIYIFVWSCIDVISTYSRNSMRQLQSLKLLITLYLYIILFG